jgi:hypothetical protein
MNNTAERIQLGNYQDIIQQLGGNKFTTMTGSKIKYYGHDNNGYVYLMVELIKNQSGAKFLKIQYNYKDLYNMEFTKIKRTVNKEWSLPGLTKVYDEESVIVESFEDVWGEDLQRIFTQVTGLYTRLF